jgi:uncharacterized protein
MSLMDKGVVSSPNRGPDIVAEPSSGVPGAESSADLVRLAAAAQNRAIAGPPRAPKDCGDFDIHIDVNGDWFHQGRPIRRPAMVKLFSTVLRREDGGYFLVTPAERGRITVADAPFIGVELTRLGEGKAQSLELRTNLDEIVTLGPDHPLRVATSAAGEPRPYVIVRDGLEARLLRPVFYQLVELGAEERVGAATLLGVWSMGAFFPLGRIEPT